MLIGKLPEIELQLIELAREEYDKNPNTPAIAEIDTARQHLRKACIILLKTKLPDEG